MAGRGRGRGRSNLTFSIEAMGFAKGEGLPPSILQPTPLFPPMEHKPVPLATGEEAEYMQALKQEFRGAMKTLPFYIRPAAPKTDVERYSDKYHSGEPADNVIDWKPDWSRLPKELRIRVRKPVENRVSLPVDRMDRSSANHNLSKKEDVLLKLEALEKGEKAGSSEDEDEDEAKKKQKEEEGTEGEEEYEEEELEEGTDYIMSYFDNGEDNGGDSDENLDEAVY
ncbi:RNA polymerase III subunit GL b [Gadus macrocephalus]|uniref:RNA polymerase III subunit GL b n=1 Tax=Gadus macrocephalus TaxID=80720 RepID=UPI0028CB2FC8|nr:RNA polymerase III subunit GL b [Gadus macrocephalus]